MKHIKGDLVEAFKNDDVQIMVHQVNCQGVMGGGIAKHIRNEFPEHYNDYLELLEEGRRLGLDKTSDFLASRAVTTVESGRRYITGVFTQDEFGKDKRYTNYAALTLAMSELMRETCIAPLPVTIGIPKYLGCGLAGGDWGIVETLLEELEGIHDIELVAYEL